MGERRTVLIVRPEPEASATARALLARGYAAVAAPALRYRRLETLEPADLEGAQAVALTSAAAARALGEDLGAAPAGLIAFCVGAKTAAAAKDAGFARLEVGEGDAAALLARLRGLEPAAGPIVVLRGRETAFPLSDRLREAGFAVAERLLYGADQAERLPDAARLAIAAQDVRAALFLSARNAEAFLNLLAAERNDASLPLLAAEALCNSARSAAPLRDSADFSAVLVAAAPTLEAVLDLLPPPS